MTQPHYAPFRDTAPFSRANIKVKTTVEILLLDCCLTTLSVSKLYSIEDRIMNEHGAVSEKRIGRGNRSTRRETAPVPLRPP
jgi:hypothetical protein